MRKKLSAITTLLYIFSMTALSPSAYAAGFAIFTQGAAELAQGNSVIAHTEGPASLFFNPALMGKLEGTQAEIGVSMLSPVIKYDSDTPGEDSKTKNMDCYPSTIYVTHKYNEKLSTGLGLFTPFGLGAKWKDDWEGRYIVTESEMTTLDINPALSYKAGRRLSLAAGLNVLLLNTRTDNKINQLYAPLPDADGEQSFKGDGDGFGYNIGLLYEINDDLSLGASYRSAIDIEIAGKISFDVTTSLSNMLGGIPASTDAEADITLPAQAHLGLSYKVSRPLLIEAALRWVEWSVYDKVTTDTKESIATQNSSTVVNKWKDTFALKLGGRYKLSEKTALFTGYQYEKGASPDETFNPGIPDSDSHAISIGGSTIYKDLNIKVAYAYKKFEDRQINNNVGGIFNNTADGEYEADMHMIATSLTYTF